VQKLSQYKKLTNHKHSSLIKNDCKSFIILIPGC